MSNGYIFSNLAKSTLAAGITSGATSLTVATGNGTLFPSPVAGQYFACVLTDAATQTLFEVVLVTAKSTDTFTVTRAQEGTTARAWLLGDIVSHRMTAGQMAALAQTANLPGTTSTSIIYYGTDTGSADSIVSTTSPAIGSYVDGTIFEITPIATNVTSTPQANICSLGAKQFSNAIPGSIVAGQKLLFSYDSASGKMQILNEQPVATTTTRGIVRQATTTEQTNKVTSGSTPAFVTPEGLQTTGPWSGTPGSGVLPVGAMLFLGGFTSVNTTGSVTYSGSYVFSFSGGGGGSDWRMPSAGSGSITGTWTVVAFGQSTGPSQFTFILRTS
jgi:hypothetical protein